MRSLLYSMIFVVIISGCGSHKSGDPKPLAQPPVAALLVFPELNALCISGTITSSTESSVQLKWNPSANTDSYDVSIKNLLTQSTETHNTTQTQLNVSLLQNTPYSWQVISKSNANSSTATSDSWKFYNSGQGVVSYAPFPADGLTPALGQFVTVSASGQISLSWHGSDADNDIVNYDIYFGTDPNPPVIKQGSSTTSLDGVAAASKTKYYWKVVTFDSHGNSSTSDIVQFSTN
ncbi:hypothetical protein [Mucilaginibacter flavidus]|uniref:hypothetical protein n=1 Tax=Mucilaginibacter flavidus TaxID=2949309 RepID=UPI002092E663|nr:hypothetical protein [Mucilaginibacter flavidus]MCO5948695.1 hypothetical protein [Mucilaginibacter flavidus]